MACPQPSPAAMDLLSTGHQHGNHDVTKELRRSDAGVGVLPLHRLLCPTLAGNLRWRTSVFGHTFRLNPHFLALHPAANMTVLIVTGIKEGLDTSAGIGDGC